MTVRELIERFQQVDPEQDAYLDAYGGEYFYEVNSIEVCDEGLCLV
jgi:hypothetical protein